MYNLISLLLIGCPEPIDQNQGAVDGTAAKDQADMSAANSIPTNVDGTVDNKLAHAPPTMGTFPGDLADTELVPRYSQSELKGDGVIHGYVRCDDCVGRILVRALPPPPEGNNNDPSAMQLITQATLDGAGAFSLYVPDNSKVVLQVVDDANGDGVPNQGERMGMRGSGPLSVSGSVEGIELTVGVFPQKEPTDGVIPPPDPVPGSNPDADLDEDAPPEDNGQALPEGVEPPSEQPGNVPPGGAPPSEGTPPGATPPGGNPPGATPPGGNPPGDSPPADDG
ncbi:MAG: hypothetical protein VX278_22130 [Myxococcota bacterium]|nr:hypothetical protein [Myxococcota bacterium]